MQGGPSDQAVTAAFNNVGTLTITATRRTLNAAHDPALGLDRSVCLRDVVEALRNTPALQDELAHEGYQGEDAADFIEQEFTTESPS